MKKKDPEEDYVDISPEWRKEESNLQSRFSWSLPAADRRPIRSQESSEELEESLKRINKEQSSQD